MCLGIRDLGIYKAQRNYPLKCPVPALRGPSWFQGWAGDVTALSAARQMLPPSSILHPAQPIPVQEGHGIPTEPQCPLQLLPQQGHTQRGLRQQFGSPLWDLMPLGPLSPWEHHPLGHNMPFLPFPP